MAQYISKLFDPLIELSNINFIMVVADRLTKGRPYSPCHTKMTASKLTKFFVAEFWKAVYHWLQINLSLSTAYYPETDSQIEIANAFMEQYPRQYIDYSRKDFFDWLPMAEFAANDTVNSFTQVTPFSSIHEWVLAL